MRYYRAGVNLNTLGHLIYISLCHKSVISQAFNYAPIIFGRYVGNLWHDKSFDRLNNLPAIMKCVVFVTTSPGLPYHNSTSGADLEL